MALKILKIGSLRFEALLCSCDNDFLYSLVFHWQLCVAAWIPLIKVSCFTPKFGTYMILYCLSRKNQRGVISKNLGGHKHFGWTADVQEQLGAEEWSSMRVNYYFKLQEDGFLKVLINCFVNNWGSNFFTDKNFHRGLFRSVLITDNAFLVF